MEIIIFDTPEEANIFAATKIARQIGQKANSVLGLATGSTPLGLYRELIRMHQQEALDFALTTTFNLDEYIGIVPDHPASYNLFMRKNLFEHINIPPAQTHIPNGCATDIPAHCKAYEQAIRDAGGIDIQVLGIGTDGHIGFNEPTSSLASRTRIKTLTEQTRSDNARFFDNSNDVPHHCITMGLGTILDSRACLVLAFGSGKADAVAAAVEGPVSSNVPASVLQFHQHVHMLLDRESAAKLERIDYYRWVYENKPDWQR